MNSKARTGARKAGRKSRGRQRVDRTVEEIRFGEGKSSLGWIMVAFSEKGAVSILSGQNREALLAELEERFPEAHFVPANREDLKVVARVIAHVEKPARALDLTLDLRGTAFQKQVWKAVMEIPAGESSTYAEIAHQIGRPKAVRAVGTACANCFFSFAVPCHRVLPSGSLARKNLPPGTDRRCALLEREKA